MVRSFELGRCGCDVEVFEAMMRKFISKIGSGYFVSRALLYVSDFVYLAYIVYLTLRNRYFHSGIICY